MTDSLKEKALKHLWYECKRPLHIAAQLYCCVKSLSFFSLALPFKGLKRTSVFERLGAESKADTTTSNTKVRLSVYRNSCSTTWRHKEKLIMLWCLQPTGVFSRLDRGEVEEFRPAPGKIAGNVDMDDEDDSDEEGSVLQYAGVLKKPTASQKKEPAPKPAPLTLRRLGGKFKLPPSDTPTSSSSPNGLPPAKLSVLQRLGKFPATHQGSAVSPAPADTQDNRVTTSTRPRAQEKLRIASPKVSSSTGAGGGAEPAGAQMDVRAVSVFKRLGSKKT